jgi:wyosine [tRNA(Phe)-imidazoG37] synthetase (radical SAM superfamily)
VQETKNKLEELKKSDEKADYITFVPDGEPTLDINLGATIEKLKKFEIKLAIITNSSMLFNNNIRNELMLVDWVSLKIDTIEPEIWRKINRPHGCLNLELILDGIKNFASSYRGVLVTETMLVKGINDSNESITGTARVIKTINPRTAYILIPTRPPAEAYVIPPDEKTLNATYQVFTDHNINTELMYHNEGDEFTYTSDFEKELLSILAVHPMRMDAVKRFLAKSDLDWNVIEDLIVNNKIKKVVYIGDTYFISKR